MELSDFIADYCVWIGQGESARLSLREKEGWDCVFLAPSGCLVYEDRPIQCRAYPFWEYLVSDPGAWESEARYCPGIGRGEAVDAERIASLLLEQRAASPWRAEAARGAEREDGKR